MVLSPKYKNNKYVDFYEGCQFGAIDIVGSILGLEEDVDFEYAFENWILYKDRLKRQFSVRTQTEVEALTLSIQDLACMRSEFIEAYESIMKNAFERLDKSHRLKLAAIKYCEKYMKQTQPSPSVDTGESFLIRALTLGQKKPKDDEFVFTAVDLREVDNEENQFNQEELNSESEHSSCCTVSIDSEGNSIAQIDSDEGTERAEFDDQGTGPATQSTK